LRKHYEKVAFSKNSFVNVDDFNSPRALAAHLNRLLANRSLLTELFAWKVELARFFFDALNIRVDVSGSVARLSMDEEQRYEVLCDLCAQLHDADGAMSRVRSVPVSKWFGSERECWNNAPHPSWIANFVANLFSTCL
jgi:hypothetical protein